MFLLLVVKKIYVFDRIRAAKHRPRLGTAIIRIFPTDEAVRASYPMLDHGDYFDYNLEYVFDDISPIDYTSEEIKERKLVLFSETNAERIITDFRQVMQALDYLVVHCDLGRRRSPAVAAALNHMFRLGIADKDYLEFIHDPDWRPNMHVYRTLIEVARGRFNLKFNAYLLGEKD